ncbi:MAG: DUF5009 domain-containing protein [Gemmatimonadota bacterium]
MTQVPSLSPRLRSLDAFRGLTIAGMILVNNPGSWSHIYAPLEHAEWNGWTPTDLIFPFFLFIVGVAMTFSFARRRREGSSTGDLLRKVIWRSVLIVAIGLALNGFPHYHLATLRYPGVLQRIGVVYLFAGAIYVTTGRRGHWMFAGALLTIYFVLMKFVPVPGYGRGVLEPEGNLAQYLDLLAFKGHMWRKTWDPEGMLSTIPAIATCLLGAVTGDWLQSGRTGRGKVVGLILAGVAGIVAGLVLDHWFPINKNLWTSSYVLFTAGMALVTLAFCYWLIDLRGVERWARPFFVFGANPLSVFVLSGLVARLLSLWVVRRPDGSTTALQGMIYDRMFASWAGLLNGSLLFAICYVLLWLAVMMLFERKRWYLRV